MDYEKKYKESLERARKLKENPKAIFFEEKNVHVSDYIFPELAESEDEKIRKELIKETKGSEVRLFETVTNDEFVSWLEKQGEQKNFASIEPKFKDGDVLYSPCLKLLWIYKSRDAVYCGCNLNYNDGAFFGEGYFERLTDAIPATKEQCDTLMKAMADAGYTFDFDKKELKKIEQKSVWSEEDMKMIVTLAAIFEVNYPDGFYKVNPIGTTNMQGIHSSEIIKWLKSLKERCSWRPSDEQRKVLFKYADQNNYDGSVLTSLYQDLKKLKGE